MESEREREREREERETETGLETYAVQRLAEVCCESVRNSVCEGVNGMLCKDRDRDRGTGTQTLRWQLAPCSSAWQDSARVHVACCARMSE